MPRQFFYSVFSLDSVSVFLSFSFFSHASQTAAFRSGAAAREAIRQNAAWEAGALLKRQQDAQAEAAQIADDVAARAMERNQMA